MAGKSTFSRRAFFLNATAAGTAVAPGALAAPTPGSAQPATPMSNWSGEADVVVIGAGAVGLPAAIVVREAGASVIVR